MFYNFKKSFPMKPSVIFRYLNLSEEILLQNAVHNVSWHCFVYVQCCRDRGFFGWVFFFLPSQRKFLSTKKDKEHSHKNNLFHKVRISTLCNIKLIAQQLNINDFDLTVFLGELISFSVLC